MSGHSKWSTIKRKKGKADAERGKIFTKWIKEITVAARAGGGDPDGNPRLRTAIAGAKGVNMPAKNIENAIKKGTGELPGVSYEENTYEGYGHAGVAILIEVLTDNKNRTTAEIRHIFTKYGGNLGENGCVSWLFDPKGIITVSKDSVDEEKLFEIAIEAGAEDVSADSDDAYEVYTSLQDLNQVAQAMEDGGITLLSQEASKIPQNQVMLDADTAVKFMRLLEMIEDHDDVQKVYSNFDVSKETLEKLQSG
ncbi:YebC/PmpR family DNA-binding transcriptional regulator [Candidatus Eisenbacteria bacterium]|uniref:Probable transcriptional regulatory protein ACFL6M_07700 n=1 Tax=Eiseniibacteriota bacterium TaxID=2212470 RepID=A0ABV6YMB1_UNCEI